MPKSKTINYNSPDYENPPVVEVSLGIQFEPLTRLNPIELGSLWELWRDELPNYIEQPPLPHILGAQLSIPATIQIGIGSPLRRYWFLNDTKGQLVQLQNDKLIVNWRKSNPEMEYPRYRMIRSNLETKFEEFNNFLKDKSLGTIKINHIEATYVNLIETNENGIGKLENIFRFWNTIDGHHLGTPGVVHSNMQFIIDEKMSGLTRMNVAISPALGIESETKILMTIQVLGTPKTSEFDSALDSLDEAHIHIVTSFDELTVPTMHEKWRRLA